MICVVAVVFCFVGTKSAEACDGWFNDDWILLDCCIDEDGYDWVLCCDLATLDMGWICLGNLWSSDTTQSTLTFSDYGIASKEVNNSLLVLDGGTGQAAGGGSEPIRRSTLDSLLVQDGGTGSDTSGGSAAPPKGRACFVADTPALVDGKLIEIQKVNTGQTISEVQEHEGTFLCRDILLETGNIISVVDAHCFMLDCGQWLAAQNLTSGQRLKTLTGTVGIKSVTTRTYTGKVYNLKIADSDQYMVGKDSVIVRDY